ncbi:hypothetical protein BD626DRAFT_574106, partial [Schizophyllum amplum]
VYAAHHTRFPYRRPDSNGACTGVTSICAIGGYALESRCHQGQRIVYDTITELGWAQDARTHPIKVIIDQLLSKPWNATTPAPPPPGKKETRRGGGPAGLRFRRRRTA